MTTPEPNLATLRAKLRVALDDVNHPNRIEIGQDDLIAILDRLDAVDPDLTRPRPV